MFGKKQVFVLDVGSSKITVSRATSGVNGTYILKGLVEEKYDGFSDGAFFDINGLDDAVLRAMNRLLAPRERINKLYVSVPGEFVSVVTKQHEISFSKPKKVTAEAINQLFDGAYSISDKRYKIINRSAMYYMLDGTRRTADPIGAVCERISGSLSYSLCETSFISIFNTVLQSIDIANIEYVSQSLAEALYLLDADQRDSQLLLLDVGYITTSLALVIGDGVAYQKSFSYGGGHIIADLAQYLEISFKIAEKLFSKINLSNVSSNQDKYDIMTDNEYLSFNIDSVNEIVFYSLDKLCETVENILSKSPVPLSDYTGLFLTGGGVSFMRGTKEYMTKRLDRLVEIVAPDVPTRDKPTDSSLLSLIDLALKQ